MYFKNEKCNHCYIFENRYFNPCDLYPLGKVVFWNVFRIAKNSVLNRYFFSPWDLQEAFLPTAKVYKALIIFKSSKYILRVLLLYFLSQHVIPVESITHFENIFWTLLSIANIVFCVFFEEKKIGSVCVVFGKILIWT